MLWHCFVIIIIIVIIIIRPHCSPTYVDRAYCYRPSTAICRSVCQSVCHSGEPCKEPCIRWGPDPHKKRHF